MYIIVVDAHSKWLEVSPMGTATALTTIQHLRTLFARFGIPESLIGIRQWPPIYSSRVSAVL